METAPNLIIFSELISPKEVSFKCNVQLATFVLTQFYCNLGGKHSFDALSQVFIDINTFSFVIRHYSYD